MAPGNITGRRLEAGRHNEVDQGLVLSGEFVVQGTQIALPLLDCAGAGDDSGYEFVVEHPHEREFIRRHAALLGVSLDHLRLAQVFLVVFGGHDYGVFTSGLAFLGRLLAGQIFAGQYATGKR